MGDSLLLTNNYKNENNTSDIYTGELIESVYSYGTISIEYNENHQMAIKFHILMMKIVLW